MDSCVMGLDFGEKRIGVALSDPRGMIALPLTAIQEKDWELAIQSIVNLIENHNVGKVVLGLPVMLGGEEGEQAARVKEFARALSECIDQPVDWWDERLSTVEAEKMLRGSGTKKNKIKSKRDSLAATLVLQAYLDNKKAQPL